ncbi:MAG: hypothetical protein F4164_02695 [Gemmatimonadales bacterium]|nr:hypothetical protein [Gemmatimonadales bacterium]MYG48284.1 hypothetical protein [Gemmatimonadales bacterium]MYK01468.1 hypothetical protein [Candidatus Palauibacter ramosifaciens]
MSSFKLFPFIASGASPIGEVLAVLAARSVVFGAGRLRRGVAAGLLLTMLTPFVPMGHVHAEEDEHEVGDVPAIEAKAASGVNGAATAQGGCPPYISGGPHNPASGVRTFGVCADVPMDPWGFVTCEVCSCWYEMHDGSTMNFSTSSGCNSAIRIQGPAPDPCSLNHC